MIRIPRGVASRCCAFIFAAFLLAACRGGHAGTEVGDPSEEMFDSSLIVVEEPEFPLDSVGALTRDLRDADEALKFMQESGNWDKYSEGLFPKIVSDNFDYVNRLLKSPYPHFIIVDKGSMHVILYDRFGREVESYGMACSRYFGAKHKYRDNRTPEGFFSAENIYDSTDWLYTDDDGVTHPEKGVYGPRFIRLKTNVTSAVGIHGTGSPGSIGRRCSHGCIRLHNDNIVKLVKYARPGMPIIVNPSAKDQAVNELEGYKIPRVNTGKGAFRELDPESMRSYLENLDKNGQSDTVAVEPADTVANAKAEKPAPETKPATPVQSEPEPEVADPDIFE